MLAAIFSIMTEGKEIHLVILHSCIFQTIELNYDIHNKELFMVFMVFKAFYTWCHYLEGSKLFIDIITDYKNLEYFWTTKVLSYCQARWLEFLSQLNFIIYFYPECLEPKPNTITHREYLYPKKERAAYNSINFQNMCSIFTYSQLITSFWAIVLVSPKLQAATIINFNSLHNNI